MVKFKVISTSEIELLEDAKKGDKINLNNADTIDLSIIKEKIVIDTKKEMTDSLNKEFKKDIEIETSKLQNEITLLQQKLNDAANEKANEIRIKTLEITKEKDNEINELKNKLENIETKVKSEKNIEIIELKNQLDNDRTKYELEKSKEINDIINKKDEERKIVEIELDRVKQHKLSLSTKAIGEDLEQYCFNKFNEIQSNGGYPNATLEKDNEVVEGTKADFIFRDYDNNNNEIISILFEMKNESDTTATKHKNEDFLDKMEKDRKKKGCDFSVLVSMLEQDNDHFNNGIVDFSRKFPDSKGTYVIRPQLFLPIISLLDKGGKLASKYKNELIQHKNENADLTNFENTINTIKDNFNNHFGSSVKKFNNAIDAIDKSISDLTKTREYLVATEKQLSLASKDLDGLEIKKLSRGNPTIKKLLEENK
jgi:hypothetical protein